MRAFDFKKRKLKRYNRLTLDELPLAIKPVGFIDDSMVQLQGIPFRRVNSVDDRFIVKYWRQTSVVKLLKNKTINYKSVDTKLRINSTCKKLEKSFSLTTEQDI